MEFCKNCGSLIYYFKEKDILKSYCKKCKLESENSGKSFNEKHTAKKIGEGVSNSENTLATYSHTCKKCGHEGVQVIDVGILISDEDNLILLKCGKCGFTERVGRKTT